MKYFLWVLRILIGVTFIFSGVVKANDPMGLAYKMNEFFEAMNMTFMMSWSFAFSVVMIAFEIVSGVAVLVGFSFRMFASLLVLLNMLFTFITAFALFTGKVKECGCFGACIKISSEATFYKDVVLLIISVVLWIFRKRIYGLFPPLTNLGIVVVAIVIASSIQWYALKHLPFNDCLAYKVGNNLWQEMQPGPNYKEAVYKTTLIYKNLKTGEAKEFGMDNIPWQDSLTWKFVSSDSKLIKDGVDLPEIPHDFQFSDSAGTDRTQEILTAKGYLFLWFIRDPETAHMDHLDRLQNIIARAGDMHIPFYTLCSVDNDVAAPYRSKWNMTNVPFLTIDGTVSKTALRSNPGLMLLKDGTVVAKWSYADYPKTITMNGAALEYK